MYCRPICQPYASYPETIDSPNDVGPIETAFCQPFAKSISKSLSESFQNPFGEPISEPYVLCSVRVSIYVRAFPKSFSETFFEAFCETFPKAVVQSIIFAICECFFGTDKLNVNRGQISFDVDIVADFIVDLGRMLWVLFLRAVFAQAQAQR